MSRSFGDEIAHSVDVSDEYEVREVELKDEDKFFVVGSDGLWKFMTESFLSSNFTLKFSYNLKTTLTKNLSQKYFLIYSYNWNLFRSLVSTYIEI